MSDVTLRPIDQSNYLDCFRLQLKPGQEEYVSHPIRSLAQAYVYYHQCTPFGVYHGDEMVGYLMVIYDDEENTYNLWHLMIDQKHQGQGYGRQAVERALDYIRTQPFGVSDVALLTCHRENSRAFGLYQRLGFRETERAEDGEEELSLRVKG